MNTIPLRKLSIGVDRFEKNPKGNFLLCRQDVHDPGVAQQME